MTVRGTVKDGRIEPDQPLPEGARVEIRLAEITMDDLPDDLREELEAWQLAGAQSLENFERMLEDEEKRTRHTVGEPGRPKRFIGPLRGTRIPD